VQSPMAYMSLMDVSEVLVTWMPPVVPMSHLSCCASVVFGFMPVASITSDAGNVVVFLVWLSKICTVVMILFVVLRCWTKWLV